MFLLAQAGVPLTAGFFAKFYVIEAAVDAGSYWLAVVAMLSAVIAAFLYLRIVVTMYMSARTTVPEATTTPPAAPVPLGAGRAGLVRLTLFVGFSPAASDLVHDARPTITARHAVTPATCLRAVIDRTP